MCECCVDVCVSAMCARMHRPPHHISDIHTSSTHHIHTSHPHSIHTSHPHITSLHPPSLPPPTHTHTLHKYPRTRTHAISRKPTHTHTQGAPPCFHKRYPHFPRTPARVHPGTILRALLPSFSFALFRSLSSFNRFVLDEGYEMWYVEGGARWV